MAANGVSNNIPISKPIKSILRQPHLGTAPPRQCAPLPAKIPTFVPPATGNEPFMNKKFAPRVFHILAAYHHLDTPNSQSPQPIPASTYYLDVDEVFARFVDDGHIVKKHIYRYDQNGKAIALLKNIQTIENTETASSTDQNIYIVIDPCSESLPNIGKDTISLTEWPQGLQDRVFIYNTQPLTWDWALIRATKYSRCGLPIIDSRQENLQFLRQFLSSISKQCSQSEQQPQSVPGINMVYLPLQMSSDIRELNHKLCHLPKIYDIGFIADNGTDGNAAISGDRQNALEAVKYALNVATPAGRPIPYIKVINKQHGSARDIEMAKCKVLVYMHPTRHHRMSDYHDCDRLIMAGFSVVIESSIGDAINELRPYYASLSMIKLPTPGYDSLARIPAMFFRNDEPLYPVINSVVYSEVQEININGLTRMLNMVNNLLGADKKYSASCISRLAIRAREANYVSFMRRLPHLDTVSTHTPT